MRRRVFLGTVAGALAAPGLLRAAPGTADLARAYVAAQGVPGVSWAYRAADGWAEAGGAGLADPGTGEAMTPDHRLRLASISKTLTAAMVLTLAREQGLDLHKPLFGEGGLLAQWRPEAPPAPDFLSRVTADHLLTHTAGGWGNAIFDPVFSFRGRDRRDLIRRVLATRPLVVPPGRVHAYSNFGYQVLGRLVEAVTGKTYGDAVRGRLVEPAGATSFGQPAAGAGGRLEGEAVYVSDEMDPYALPVAEIDAAGGWVARPADLLTLWASFDGEGAEGVPAGVAAEMARPWKPGARYGRGLALNPAHRNRWHDGSLPGTTAFAVMIDGGELIGAVANGRTETSLVAMEQMLWQLYPLLRKS